MKKKYSVLMSVYAKEKPEFLRKSMMSMYNQTVPTDDFVLVCDGPLNKRLDRIIVEMQKKFGSRLRVFRLEENRGLGLALRFGVEKCKNELVARMDSDDISVKNRIEKQLKVFEKKNVDVVGSSIVEYDENMKKVLCRRDVPKDHDEIAMMSKERNPMNHVTVMFKKDKVLTTGNYQDMPFFEDYYLWMRMIKCGCVFYNLQVPLVKVRSGESALARRGGREYFVYAKSFQKELVQTKTISHYRYFKNMFIRAVISFVPIKTREAFYKNFLRSVSDMEDAKARKKKVIIVVPSLKYLGPGIVMKNLTDGLKGRVNFQYISLRKNSKEDLERYSRYKIHELGMKKFPSIFVKRKIKNIMKRERPDLVHVNCFWPVILFRKIKCKKIVTVHSNPRIDFPCGYGKFVGGLMARKFEKSLMAYNKVVSISDYVNRLFNITNVRTIYNSVEDISFDEKNELPAGFDETAFNLYTVSVLTKIKNISRMFKIVEFLKKHNLKVRLYIVGDGPEYDYIKKEIDNRKLRTNIVLLGQRDKKYIKYLSHFCDCYISTSFNEGLGLSIIEALRDGKYICSSDFETANEILNNIDDAKVCKTDDDFVDYIKCLASKKRRNNRVALYSTENRKVFEGIFCNRKMCDAYYEEYVDISKLNVMHYIPFYGFGGIESMMMEFMKCEKQKYNFSILVEHDIEQNVLQYLTALGIRVVRIPNFKNLNFISYIMNLRRAFVNNKVDIFHSHDYSLRVLPLFFARWNGIKKRIVHVHSSSLEGTRFVNLKKMIINFNLRKNATSIVYCSHNAEQFVNLGRGEVIYNGMNPSIFHYDREKRLKVRKEHNFDEDDIIILQIGRLVPVKNFEFTIKVLKKLPSNYKLLILGDGSLKNDLKNIIKRNRLGKRVVFVGNVSNVPDYMSASDIFVLPSMFEGLPITLLEGISSGLPCFVSNTVTKDVSTLKNLTYLNLKASDWADKILETKKCANREGFYKYMESTIFNVNNFCRKLEGVYSE